MKENSYSYKDENALKTILTVRSRQDVWCLLQDFDEIVAVCNSIENEFNEPTLVIATNEKIQVNCKKKMVSYKGEHLFKVPCVIECFKTRLSYRRGKERELVELVENDLDAYKLELKRLVSGIEPALKSWDSERVQGFLFVCGYQFVEVLSKRLTNFAYVTMPGSCQTFLILPVNIQLFCTYLVQEGLTLDGKGHSVLL
jgi:hypothetical protein